MPFFRRKFLLRVSNLFLNPNAQEYFSWVYFYSKQFNSLKVSPWEFRFALPIVFLGISKIFISFSKNEFIINHIEIIRNHITDLETLKIFNLLIDLVPKVANLTAESQSYQLFVIWCFMAAFFLKTVRMYKQRRIYYDRFYEEVYSSSSSSTYMQKLAFSSVAAGKLTVQNAAACIVCLGSPLVYDSLHECYDGYKPVQEYINKKTGYYTDHQYQWHNDNRSAYKYLKDRRNLNVTQIDDLSDSFARKKLPIGHPEYELAKEAYERSKFVHAEPPINLKKLPPFDYKKD